MSFVEDCSYIRWHITVRAASFQHNLLTCLVLKFLYRYVAFADINNNMILYMQQVCSYGDISQLNLPYGTRKLKRNNERKESKNKNRICSEEIVNSKNT